MSTENTQLDKNSESIVKYIHQYLEKNEKCYEKLLEIINHPTLEEDYPDLQWALIIDQAWQMAYRQAMEDNYLSLEERKELNNIHQLGVLLKNSPKNRQALNYKVLTTFKNLVEIDKKEDTYERNWLPKLTPPNPWNKENNK